MILSFIHSFSLPSPTFRRNRNRVGATDPRSLDEIAYERDESLKRFVSAPNYDVDAAIRAEIGAADEALLKRMLEEADEELREEMLEAEEEEEEEEVEGQKDVKEPTRLVVRKGDFNEGSSCINSDAYVYDDDDHDDNDDNDDNEDSRDEPDEISPGSSSNYDDLNDQNYVLEEKNVENDVNNQYYDHEVERLSTSVEDEDEDTEGPDDPDDDDDDDDDEDDYYYEDPWNQRPAERELYVFDLRRDEEVVEEEEKDEEDDEDEEVDGKSYVEEADLKGAEEGMARHFGEEKEAEEEEEQQEQEEKKPKVPRYDGVSSESLDIDQGGKTTTQTTTTTTTTTKEAVADPTEGSFGEIVEELTKRWSHEPAQQQQQQQQQQRQDIDPLQQQQQQKSKREEQNQQQHQLSTQRYRRKKKRMLGTFARRLSDLAFEPRPLHLQQRRYPKTTSNSLPNLTMVLILPTTNQPVFTEWDMSAGATPRPVRRHSTSDSATSGGANSGGVNPDKSSSSSAPLNNSAVNSAWNRFSSSQSSLRPAGVISGAMRMKLRRMAQASKSAPDLSGDGGGGGGGGNFNVEAADPFIFHGQRQLAFMNQVQTHENSEEIRHGNEETPSGPSSDPSGPSEDVKIGKEAKQDVEKPSVKNTSVMEQNDAESREEDQENTAPNAIDEDITIPKTLFLNEPKDYTKEHQKTLHTKDENTAVPKTLYSELIGEEDRKCYGLRRDATPIPSPELPQVFPSKLRKTTLQQQQQQQLLQEQYSSIDNIQCEDSTTNFDTLSYCNGNKNPVINVNTFQ